MRSISVIGARINSSRTNVYDISAPLQPRSLGEAAADFVTFSAALQDFARGLLHAATACGFLARSLAQK
jgi:hypothetical protein